MTDSRPSPKRTMTKRMWGVFDLDGIYRNPMTLKEYRASALGERDRIAASYRDARDSAIKVLPVTVTWSAPIKRKAKRT